MIRKINLARIVNFRPLFYSFLAFLFGILSAYRLFSGDALYVSVISISFLFLIIGCGLCRKWIPIVVVIISFFVGTGFYYLGYSSFMGKSYEGEQEIVARVTDDISSNDYYYNLVLEDCFINGEGAKGISLDVRRDDLTIFETGDIISFKGYVEQVHLFEMGSFNTYYLRDGTAYSTTISSKNISIVRGNYKVDEKIRESIKNILYVNMSEENAGLAFAVLTGDKTNLTSEIKETYRGAGIIHLLTVSGLHISFLAGVIAWLLKKCKVNRFVSFFLTAVILLFYCYIGGWSPSVVRATIMGLVLILAPLFGKEYDSLTSLGIAGFLILFISPLSALDVGFLMSFSCVGSIFLLYRPLQKILRKFLPRYFAGTIAISLCAQLGILPFIASFWQDVNILSFLANLVIIPVFGIVFILLFASVIISYIPYFGVILKLSDWAFSGIYYVANFFANTSAKIHLKSFDILITLLIFVMIFTCSYYLMVSKKVRIIAMLFLMFFSSTYLCVNNFIPINLGTSVTYLTSYDDESLLLTNSIGEVLYVGNSFNQTQERWLYFNKIDKIDYVLVVDTNYSNANLFLENVREYKVKTIISYGQFTQGIEEVEVAKNTRLMAGSFGYEYIFVDNQFVGVKIDFDNNSIFFATNQKLSYNSYTYMENEISQENFDVAFLRKKYYYANRFNDTNIVVGKYSNKDVDYSYSKNGNLFIDLENKKVRCVD